MIRAAPTAADTANNLPGELREIRSVLGNYGRTRAEGVDFAAEYRLPATRFGRFTTRAAATLINSQTLRTRPDLPQIETVVHPLVAADRAQFLADINADIALFDIPLLFEKGTDAEMDATLLVTAPPDVQRARVLSRQGMTQAQFDLILQRQMPDAQKRARATHIVETLDVASTRTYVMALITHIRSKDA